MKHLPKILLIAFTFLLISCRSTDENSIVDQNTPADTFFNINVGNKWVYKTYENGDFTNPQSPFVFRGRIDSVSIVGTVNIAGLTFAKQRTKIFFPNTNLNNQESFRYLRINAKGHLVYINNPNDPTITETSGLILHPGKDMEYRYSYDYTEGNQVIGTLFFKLGVDKNIEVEGNSYLVAPYLSEFIPAVNQPDLLKKNQEISYKKGVGLVKQVVHSVYSRSYFETRLISYTIK